MKKSIVLFITVVFFISACSVYKTVVNISRLKYKLHSVSDFSLNGILVDRKSKLSDFTPIEMLKLTSFFSSGKLPVTFNLNIEAKNPNDGSGGYATTDITIKSFNWDLFLNNKKTFSGGIDKIINVPGVGTNTIIPLKVEFDLIKLAENGSLEDIIKLALSLGGINKSTANIEVIAKPILGTPIGDLTYPEPIKIVDKQFN